VGNTGTYDSGWEIQGRTVGFPDLESCGSMKWVKTKGRGRAGNRLVTSLWHTYRASCQYHFKCRLIHGEASTCFVAWISAIFFSVALRPNASHCVLILEVSRSHTTTHHSRYDSSGREISSSHRPLPDNTQHLQQTNIHAPGGIRTHDLSRRAAAHLRLRPRAYLDRHISEKFQSQTQRSPEHQQPALSP